MLTSDKPIEGSVGSQSREELIYVSRANKLSIYICWQNLFVKAFYECDNNVKSIGRAARLRRWPTAQFYVSKRARDGEFPAYDLIYSWCISGIVMSTPHDSTHSASTEIASLIWISGILWIECFCLNRLINKMTVERNVQVVNLVNLFIKLRLLLLFVCYDWCESFMLRHLVAEHRTSTDW